MSIKKIKPTSKSGFKQGYYRLKDVTKYVGTTPIIYRSSWEYKFMVWCDNNESVEKWASEPVEIKYKSRKDNKIRKYYPDFYYKAGEEEYLVEIKPKAQITYPKPPVKNTRKALESYKFLCEAYVTNTDKYIAAKDYCEGRKWKFIVLTEDTIGNGLR